MRAYDEIADWFAATRSPAAGVPEVAALARTLPPGAPVLDLGCGTGVPLSQTLRRAGCALTALDSSPAMAAHYRARVPGVPVHVVPVQEAVFAPAAFDAVVAWGVLFHLCAAEQAGVIARVAPWLRPGGRLLFTSGAARGVSEGTMDGVAFRYVSLGVGGYRRALARDGLRLERHHTDAWQNHVYVASRPAPAG